MVSQFEVRRRLHPDQLPGPPCPRHAPAPTAICIKWLNNRADGLPAYLRYRHGDPERARSSVWTRASTTPPPSTSAAICTAICASTTPPICSTTRPSRSTRTATRGGSAPGSVKTIGLFGGTRYHRCRAGERRHRRERLLQDRRRAHLGGPRLHRRADHAAVRLPRHAMSTASSTPSSASGT